jgi:hypothetical protein
MLRNPNEIFAYTVGYYESSLGNLTLKGQSHEKVYEFLTWDDSFSLN